MNILTIDLEDWFHILAHDQTAMPHQWENFESRVERNTDWILEQLNAAGHRATFFCLGWIAQRHRGLIKRIVEAGHEVACHSMHHQLVYEQTPGVFERDLVDCIRLLEEISGQKITTYRAPGFSISEKTKWVFEILAKAGIENDCSVFPLSRNHGGYKNFPGKKPCLIAVNGMKLKEFPMSTASFGSKEFVFSGGGYFRLLPSGMIGALMKRSEYVMTYFHPRDFDPEQPIISSLSLKRKFMSYVGLRSSKKKLEMLLNQFQFLNVREAVGRVDWNKVATVSMD